MITPDTSEHLMDGMINPKPVPLKIDNETVFVRDLLSKRRMRGYFQDPSLFDALKQEGWHCLDQVLTQIREYKTEDPELLEIEQILFDFKSDKKITYDKDKK